MTNIKPPAASTPAHTQAGVNLTTETTTFTAGQTLQFQNNGNTVVHIQATIAGTGTVNALVSANNQSITIASGANLYGPFPQATFGTSPTITTATATGSVACYQQVPMGVNGTHNPFEATATATDY